MAFLCRKSLMAVTSASLKQRTMMMSFGLPLTPLTPQGQIRYINLWPPFLSTVNSKQLKTFEQVLLNAEKIVGYPTSFLGLRFLLSDEFSNIVMYIRKIVGTQHPLLSTIRTMLNDGKNGLQTRGLLVLLISKAANSAEHRFKNKEQESVDLTNGIYAGQRAIAEIAEMIHTAYIIHKDVVNLAREIGSIGREGIDDLHNGNKMAILSGDFLLAQACKGLAELQNTKVVELMSEAISEITEGQFVSTLLNHPPSPSIDQWGVRNFLMSGSLVSKSCRSALELAGHSEDLKSNAGDLARHITTAKQLHTDLQKIKNKNITRETLYPDIMNMAPVVLHCENRGVIPPLNEDRVIDEFLSEVRVSECIDMTSSLCLEHCQQATLSLKHFPHSDATEALQDMITAVSKC